MFSIARVNSVLFYLLWTSVPVLVSILSFFAFVAQGNQLTVSVAFTVRINWFYLFFGFLNPMLTGYSIVQHGSVS